MSVNLNFRERALKIGEWNKMDSSYLLLEELAKKHFTKLESTIK